MNPIPWFRLFVLLALGTSSLNWVVASESYIAIFDRGPASSGLLGVPTTPYGYAALTLSEFSDLLCYSIQLEDPRQAPLGVQLLRRYPEKETVFSEAEVPDRRFGLGQAGGCLGPLSAEQRLDLQRGGLRIRVATSAFPDRGIEAQVVSVSSAADSLAMSPEQWEALSGFLELDDRQWALLQGLLKLEAEDWERFRLHLRTEGRVQISSSGLVSAVSPGAGGAGSPQFVLTTNDLQRALTPVKNASNQAKSAVSSGTEMVMSVVKGIDLPRPGGDKLDLGLNRALEEIDALVGQIEQAVLRVQKWIEDLQNSPWAARLDKVRDALQDNLTRGLEYLRTLRSDYVLFLTNKDGLPDCGFGSPCAAFREKLLLFVGNVQTTLSTIPRLAEVDIPEFQIGVLRRLVEATPMAGLFLLSRIEQVFPQWQSQAGQLADLLSDLFPAGSQGEGFRAGLAAAVSPSGPDQPASEEARCRIFVARPKLIYLLQLLVQINETFLSISNEFCPNDVTTGLTVEFGLRGTLDTTPCRKFLGGLAKLFTFVRSKVADYISDCQSVLSRSYLSYENNLHHCRQLPGLWLPTSEGGTLEKVQSLVQLRREQVFQSGLLTGFADLFLFESDRATQPDPSSNQGPDYPKAYDCLCSAYDELQSPSATLSDQQRGACAPSRFEQVAFLGRNDDGDEVGASSKADPNTGWSQTTNRNFRIRFAVRELWGQPENNFHLQLQYRLLRASNFPGWQDVNRNSDLVRSSDSPHLQDGGHTTQQISGFRFISQNKGLDDRDGRAGGNDWDFAGGDGAEAEFSLLIPFARALDGDRIQFRVVKFPEASANGQAVGVAYSQIPEIRVVKIP